MFYSLSLSLSGFVCVCVCSASTLSDSGACRHGHAKYNVLTSGLEQMLINESSSPSPGSPWGQHSKPPPFVV